jgi:hypothetical protein
MINTKKAAALGALLAAVVLSAGCEPQEGQKCDHPGSFTTRVKDGKRINLSCQQTGINSHGKSTYTWVKVP